MKKAVSVFSGGLDCTVATTVFDNDYEILAITFNYGQKAATQEINVSKKICEKMGWNHEVIDLPWLSDISNSSLNTDEDVPEVSESDLNDLDKSSETASNVWVPARNTVFTSIALSYAESIGAQIIIVGWNNEEGATFPDNSKNFLKEFNELIKVQLGRLPLVAIGEAKSTVQGRDVISWQTVRNVIGSILHSLESVGLHLVLTQRRYSVSAVSLETVMLSVVMVVGVSASGFADGSSV